MSNGIFAETDSALISELFNLRQAGDYEVDFNMSLEDAQAAVKHAAQFLEAVRTYLAQNGFTS